MTPGCVWRPKPAFGGPNLRLVAQTQCLEARTHIWWPEPAFGGPNLGLGHQTRVQATNRSFLDLSPLFVISNHVSRLEAHCHILKLTLRSYHLILSELITNFRKHYCTYWSKTSSNSISIGVFMETPEDLCWLLLF